MKHPISIAIHVYSKRVFIDNSKSHLFSPKYYYYFNLNKMMTFLIFLFLHTVNATDNPRSRVLDMKGLREDLAKLDQRSVQQKAHRMYPQFVLEKGSQQDENEEKAEGGGCPCDCKSECQRSHLQDRDVTNMINEQGIQVHYIKPNEPFTPAAPVGLKETMQTLGFKLPMGGYLLISLGNNADYAWKHYLTYPTSFTGFLSLAWDIEASLQDGDLSRYGHLTGDLRKELGTGFPNNMLHNLIVPFKTCRKEARAKQLEKWLNKILSHKDPLIRHDIRQIFKNWYNALASNPGDQMYADPSIFLGGGWTSVTPIQLD